MSSTNRVIEWMRWKAVELKKEDSNKKAIKVKVLWEENRGCGVWCVNCLRNNTGDGSWHLPFPRHLPPYCCCRRTVSKRWTSQDPNLYFYTGFHKNKQRWLVVLNTSLSCCYFWWWCNLGDVFFLHRLFILVHLKLILFIFSR